MKIKLGLGAALMSDVAVYCGGELVGDGQREFEYVCTDSREADEKTLFVATRGERVDGHSYIASAQGLGCTCFLCERVPEGVCDGSVFCVVDNSIDAFATLAQGYRKNNPIDTVAITGSVGKTTTKEMTSRVLNQGYNLYSTEGNYNSVIGMPMSMLEVEDECNAAVFEMGMSGFGEIHNMSVAASPRISLVTNIGSSHLEYLGTRENIAAAKLEIADGLREGGILLLNGDEPLLRGIAPKNNCKILYASVNSNGDFCAENIRFTTDSSIFDLRYEGGAVTDITVPAVGLHIVYDALFAASVGVLMNVSGEGIKAGLSRYVPGAFRQRIYGCRGMTFIADCYNAAPESVKGALDVLSRLEGKRKIAVLGDMKELGENSLALHREVGGLVAQKGIDILLTVGELASAMAEGAMACGMSEDNIYVELDGGAEATVNTLRELLTESDAVLFKASRSMKFENIIERIEQA